MTTEKPHTPTNWGRDAALIAVFAAFIAACALIPAIDINGLVPITLQTFAILLAGAVLGVRRGFLAALLYVALGAIGLPVYSGGSAGLGVFAGPSVGYLVSFPFAAALCGFIVERLPRRTTRWTVPLLFLAGVVSSFVLIHPLGILGMAWRADLSLTAAFVTDLSFWPGDFIKNLAMALIAAPVHRAFPQLLPARVRR